MLTLQLQNTIFGRAGVCLAIICLILLLPSHSASGQPKTDQTDCFFSDSSIVQMGGVKMIPIQTPKGKFNVWTKRIGINPTVKVLLLAGGPGLPHDYLEVFEHYFPGEGIEFYYYDEMGSGNSDKPNDPSRYNIRRAVDEVERVRRALKLDKDNFYLYGHSWGGVLAMEYALQYQEHIKALIISNMFSSGREFNRYVREVLELSEKKDYANPTFMDLVKRYSYEKFICRIPLDQCTGPLDKALNKLNLPYYTELQGPGEFGITGQLRDWDVSTRLKDIFVPTLMIGAKYDEIDAAHIEWMSRQVQNGYYLYCPNGSHLSMYDDQLFYMKGIIQFIKEIDDRNPLPGFPIIDD